NKHPNLLVINIQPDEGITLHLNAKKSGAGSIAQPIKLAYKNTGIDGVNTPEAYEKLLHDCMLGDATNFTHWDEVARSCYVVDSILDRSERETADVPNYAADTMGPKASEQLLEKDGFHW